MRSFLSLALTFLLLAGVLGAQCPLTKQAIKRIEQYEALVPKLADGDIQKANLYLNQVNWARKRLNASNEKSHAAWVDADKRLTALVAAIQKKAGQKPPAPGEKGIDLAKLVQLDKEIVAAYNNFAIVPPKLFADAGRVAGIERELTGLETRFKEFPADHETVVKVGKNLTRFRSEFDARIKSFEKDAAGVGEAKAYLDGLAKKYTKERLPQPVAHPFSAERMQAWAHELKRWRDVELPADLAKLETLSQNAALNQQNVSSKKSWLSFSLKRQLDEQEHAVRERVASDVNEGQYFANFILETDASDRNQVVNRVLGRGRFDENALRLANGLEAVGIARMFEQAMGEPAIPGIRFALSGQPKPATPDRNAQEATMKRAIDHLKALARTALSETRMPKAASTDPALAKVAKEALTKAKAGPKAWLRMVQNTKKTEKVRREAWARQGSISTVQVSYYEYKWEEFQVTTAEEKDGEVWLFSNTLRRYSQGDPQTLLDTWYLARRFELTPILRENVPK